jgi:hypothetical protein
MRGWTSPALKPVFTAFEVRSRAGFLSRAAEKTFSFAQ